MHNDHNFDVKLMPEFFDAKFIICIIFPVKNRKGMTQATVIV